MAIQAEDEFLVWRKRTWGSYGQHENVYCFVINLETLEQVPIFRLIKVRHVNLDSRKNLNRYTFAKLGDIRALKNVVLKMVHDYQSSGGRRVRVDYLDTELKELKCERGLKDNDGFYDLVYLPDGRKLRCTKDAVQVVA
jgi:hypothetical protein